MKNHFQTIKLLAVALACGTVLALSDPAWSQHESFVVVDSSPTEPQLIPAVPAAPQPVLIAPGQEELAPPSTAVTVHPVARIDYDFTHRARKIFRGSPFVNLTMVTQNPADGCFYEIPLCLPACCVGEPQVTSHCGLMGRGVVVYCYECGLEIEVKFRLRGDVEVEYGT